MSHYINSRYNYNYLYLILSTNLVSFLLSYLLDAASLAIAVKTIYHTNFSIFLLLKTTAICVVTYFLLLLINYLLIRINLYISLSWASWSLSISNIVWLFAFINNTYIIMLFQQPITGAILTYFLLVPIFYLLKKYNKCINIIPETLDIGDAVVSSFVGLLAKTIMALIIL